MIFNGWISMKNTYDSDDIADSVLRHNHLCGSLARTKILRENVTIDQTKMKQRKTKKTPFANDRLHPKKQRRQIDQLPMDKSLHTPKRRRAVAKPVRSVSFWLTFTHLPFNAHSLSSLVGFRSSWSVRLL